MNSVPNNLTSGVTLVDGIPSLKGSTDFHYGEIDRFAMQTLNADIVSVGRQSAFEKLYAGLDADRDAIVDSAVNGYWLPWLPLIDTEPGDRILDIGPGWGHASVHFARRGCDVTAVDSSLERLRYVQTRFADEHLANGKVLHMTSMDALPFDDQSLSVVVMHDVLDRLPEMSEGNPGRVQQNVLNEANRVLQDGGLLVMAVANRWSWRCWAGAADARTGLRYVSLAPRLVADLCTRICQHGPYRTYSHGIRTYQQMLNRAGFEHARVLCPLQDHRRCKQLFDLSNRAACAHAMKRLMWCGRSSRVLLAMANKIGALGWLVPSYMMFATRGNAEVRR